VTLTGYRAAHNRLGGLLNSTAEKFSSELSWMHEARCKGNRNSKLEGKGLCVGGHYGLLLTDGVPETRVRTARSVRQSACRPRSANVTSYTATLALQITRCVNDQSYPGWVECQFTDAGGKLHTLVDKVPIFSLDQLDTHSLYPCPGLVRCKILGKWQDETGREVVSLYDSGQNRELSTPTSVILITASRLSLR